MILNGTGLLSAAPIKDMRNHKIQTGHVTAGLSEAGYDIRLKQDVVFSPKDLRDPYGYDTWAADLESGTGRFCLASAIEEFQMPDNLVGIVHDKSSWAREGLSVFNTVIEPGFFGGLTLELVYHGSKGLHIPAGSGIAQVVFHQTTENRPYTGRYQNQSNEPVSAIFL